MRKIAKYIAVALLFVGKAYAQDPIGDQNGNTLYYWDGDGDGYGANAPTKVSNNGIPYGYADNNQDLDDNNYLITNVPGRNFYRDADGDNFGNPNIMKFQSMHPSGYVTNSSDCNDGNAALHPNTVWYYDFDNDGWGNPNVTKKQCTQPSRYILRTGDYNDTNDLITNAAPRNFYRDVDGDSFGNPSTKTYRSYAPVDGYSYVLNGDDCNDGNAELNPNAIWYRDVDGDGWGSDQGLITNDPPTIRQCSQPGGYANKKGDLHDNNVLINDIPPRDFYRDSDNDSYGNHSTKTNRSYAPINGFSYVLNGDDIYDGDPLITNILPKHFYRDSDNDTFGDLATRTFRSVAPNDGYIYVLNGDDCNDNDPTVHSGTIWYDDSDGDGFGDPNHTKMSCEQPTAYVANNADTCPEEYGEEQGCLFVLSNENYVSTRTYQEPMSAPVEVSTYKDVIQSITYHDGLGRVKQQVAIKASPKANDIVTHITYDQYGRQAKQYLPFERQNGYSGSYTTVDVTANINRYYQNKYPDDFTGSTNAYSESIFEPSPLNRVVEQGAPGTDWKANPNTDTDHTIKFDWSTNTANEVIYFKVNFTNNNTVSPTLVKDGFYNAGELYIYITKDENWQPNQTHPNDHTTKEYKDKQGRIVLKRTYNNNIPHDTYYVYDDYGNLTYVLPPKVYVNDGVSATELSELCYQYKYDERNRLIEKKIPGKGDADTWESIVYNKLDQPILTQDPNQKVKNEWLFTKYDAFGRVAYTGKISIPSKTRTQLQLEATAYTDKPWVNTTTTGIRYDDGGYPKVTSGETLTVNYYDDYNFDKAGLIHPGTVSGEAITNRTRSLSTGSKVKVLGEDKWITTVTYYDKKGRPIYVASKNEYLNTTNSIESKLDFVGKVLKTISKHKKGTNAEIVTVDNFTYDHANRLLTHRQCIGDSSISVNCENVDPTLPEHLVFSQSVTTTINVVASKSITLSPGFHMIPASIKTFSAKIPEPGGELIVANTYDELGKLTSKEIGYGLQDVNYAYNVRGWLKDINNDAINDNDLFNFTIKYNDITDVTKKLYNGNISQTEWNTNSINTTNNPLSTRYTYSYDALNRITNAIDNTSNYNLTSVAYDKNGNITNLERKGQTNTNVTAFGTMDRLSYDYGTVKGNKLLKVIDTGNKTYGFKDGTNTNNDYEYDINGNMIKDQNKGITSITYNHLNLPAIVSISNNEGAGNISYIYDATGAKLKKIVNEGGSLTETEYAGKYVYKNGTLQYLSTPEGYATPTVTPSEVEGYRYVYQYKDHLDNVRLSYTKNDAGDLEIVEENNYYPFGLQHKGYNSSISSLGNSTAQLLNFGGKEEQDELGLGWIDITARNYDPELGRWMNLDPLAEQMRRHSPYNYAFDNPIYFLDPDGMKPTGPCGSKPCPDAISSAKVKKAQFFNPSYKPQGKIFSASGTLSGKLGPSINIKASAGNTKASISGSIAEGSVTSSTEGKISAKGNILKAEVGFGVNGIGESKVSLSAGQLKGSITESGAEGEVSLLAVDLKATIKNGFTVAESGAMISSNEEKSGKFTGSYKASEEVFSGTLSGNKVGVGAGVGSVSAAVSGDVNEMGNMLSNIYNKVIDVLTNGWNSTEESLNNK